MMQCPNTLEQRTTLIKGLTATPTWEKITRKTMQPKEVLTFMRNTAMVQMKHIMRNLADARLRSGDRYLGDQARRKFILCLLTDKNTDRRRQTMGAG